jgi:redox-sensitive bicupin YhaK (pirin superfamily)
MAEAIALSRRVQRVGAARRMSHGTGFVAYCMRLNTVGPGIDPFLSIDHFFISQPIFPPHPHAGFSAVTYLFEDSQDILQNRDSLGDRTDIHPGDLHWTQAARGIVHEEVPSTPGRIAHGVQMFINLAAEEKLKRAQAFHLSTEFVPEFQPDVSARVRVLCGSAHALHAPINPAGWINIVEAKLSAGTSLQHDVAPSLSAFALMLSGSAAFGPMTDPASVKQHQAALLSEDGRVVEVTAGKDGAHYLLCSGMPLKEPMVAKGSFVMNTAEQVQRVAEDYAAGRLGRLDPTY